MKARAALCVLAAALALPAVTAASLAAGEQRTPGVVASLRLPGGTDWGYPSPFAYSRGPGLVNVHFVFDSLLWKDGSGQVIPWLASAWRRSPNGLEYVFRIRRNARWHDGKPVTSKDVAFTFQYMATGPGSRVLGISPPLTMIRGIATPDERTVVFALSQRFAPFPITIAGRVPIIPEHVWRGVSDPARFRGPEAVVGSGPYRLADYEAATGAYRFVANPTFWNGRPVVRELRFVPITDELLALRQGTLDAGSLPFEQGVPRSVVDSFAKSQAWGMLDDPGEWNRTLHFNLARGFPFDNRAFRVAVAHAIDRRDLVRRVLLGQGQEGSMGVVAPSSPWAAKGLPTYPFDPGRARSLLASIGLVDRNGDGWRDLPSGDSFQPQLLTSTFQNQATAQIVWSRLRDVGLDVRLTTLDRNAADAATAAGNYQMALVGFGGMGGDPDFLRTMFSGAARSRSFTRVIGYANPRFEEVAAAQLVTVRRSTRERFVHEMQRILAQDVPIVPLYYPNRVWIYRKAVFSTWYHTPEGVFGGYPGTLNKHAFVTGQKTGF